MELSAADPWGAPAVASSTGSAGPSPPPTVPAAIPDVSGPWGAAAAVAPAPAADPWGVASPTSPTSTDPWGGGAPPPTAATAVAPPADPWGETSSRVNSVDPWGGSGESRRQRQPSHSRPIGFVALLKQKLLAALLDQRGCEKVIRLHIVSTSLITSYIHNSSKKKFFFSVTSISSLSDPKLILNTSAER